MASCNPMVKRTAVSCGLCVAMAFGCQRHVAPVARQAPVAAPCDSPYFPIREGATWTYDIGYTGMATPNDSGVVEGQFTQTITHVRPGGFDLEQHWPYVTQTIPWQCRPEGLVALQRGGETTQADRDGHGSNTFRTESVEGVGIPIPWPSVGGSWNVVYRVRGEGTTHTGARVDSHIVYASTYTVAGPETIHVEGHVYDAVRLRVSNTIRTDVLSSDHPTRMTNTLTEEGTSWYAAGVGWVRTSLTSHGPTGAPVQSVTDLAHYALEP